MATIAAVTAGKLRRGMISSVPTGANISSTLLFCFEIYGPDR
ncbi:MAG: hypothetical protein WBL92_06670 [Methanothrix sp.]